MNITLSQNNRKISQIASYKPEKLATEINSIFHIKVAIKNLKNPDKLSVHNILTEILKNETLAEFFKCKITDHQRPHFIYHRLLGFLLKAYNFEDAYTYFPESMFANPRKVSFLKILTILVKIGQNLKSSLPKIQAARQDLIKQSKNQAILHQKNENLKINLNKMTEEFNDVKIESEENKKLATEKSERIYQNKMRSKEIDQKIANTVAQIDKNLKMRNPAYAEIDRLKERIENMKSEFNPSISGISKNVILENSQEIEKLKEQITLVDEKYAKVFNKLKRTESDNLLITEIAKLKNEDENLNILYKKFEDQLVDKCNEYEEYVEKCKKLQSLVESLKGQVADIKPLANESLKDSTIYRKKIAVAQDELSVIQKDINDLKVNFKKYSQWEQEFVNVITLLKEKELEIKNQKEIKDHNERMTTLLNNALDNDYSACVKKLTSTKYTYFNVEDYENFVCDLVKRFEE